MNCRISIEIEDGSEFVELYRAREGQPKFVVPFLHKAFTDGRRDPDNDLADVGTVAALIIGTDVPKFKPIVGEAAYEYILTVRRADPIPYWFLEVRLRGKIILHKTPLAVVSDTQVSQNFEERVVNLMVRVPSDSAKGVYYNVMQYTDETWECTCPGFRFGNLCKHIKHVKEKMS